MSEQELIQAARSGDQKAFAALVEANQAMVYSLAYRMTGNSEDAADLTQEAFLNAWRGLARFQGQASFSTWLYRLTTSAGPPRPCWTGRRAGMRCARPWPSCPTSTGRCCCCGSWRG